MAVRSSSMRRVHILADREWPSAPWARHLSSIASCVAASAVGEVARHDFGIGVIAGESGGEDHAGIVAQGVGQTPPLGKLRALGGGLVAHDQRDAGIAQGVDAGGDGQAGDAVERGQALGGNAEFALQIESAAAAGQLDHIRHIGDGLEDAARRFRS